MNDSFSRPELPAGLYEEPVSKKLQQELSGLEPFFQATSERITPEHADLFVEYIKDLLLVQLETIQREYPKKEQAVEAQTNFVNQVIDTLTAVSRDALIPLPPKYLTCVYPATDRQQRPEERPDTALTQNAIFTGGTGELQLGSQLVKEIRTADEIWFVISFLRWSGVQILLDALEEATHRGVKLHVVTTIYMGATEAAAVERLAGLSNTDLYVSYDTTITRLHAKGYVFSRNSGYHTAYIGSSNLSAPALSDGFEWNVKISAKASPDVFERVLATCEAYTHDPHFRRYKPEDKEILQKALARARFHTVPGTPQNLTAGEMEPYPYQERILEKLQVERDLYNRFRNLVVAATGTGKTVIAAFDYRRFHKINPKKSNLLFIAHREEILRQAEETFRKVLGDADFGSLLVGGHEPGDLAHLFVSIQSLNSRRLWEKLRPDYYNYIIVDEAHHTEAGTYKEALKHFRPEILLGLTATPERTDRRSILDDFDEQIAAEIRLPDAIDQGLLCPFHYFGLEDTVDLDQVRWNRGGYDNTQLENLYVYETAVAEKRAEHVMGQLKKHVQMTGCRGLGFCVSVAHARFMTEYFNRHGIRSRCITGDLPSSERKQYREELEHGAISIIFCVDVFNEGIDIPCINTIMLLRPTESLVVFLQQLGRGLRLHEGKAALCVLDFVGNANNNYRFEEKFSALLPPGQNLKNQVKDGFTRVPRGCFMELEEKPMRIVLASIAQGFDSRSALIQRVRQYKEEQGYYPNIAQFLTYYHLKPRDVYYYASFDALLRAAQGSAPSAEPLAAKFESRTTRMHFVYLDSYRWLTEMADLLPQLPEALGNNLSRDKQLMLGMFYTSIWSTEAIPEMDSPRAREQFSQLKESPALRQELIDLFSYMASQLTIMSWPLDIKQPCPLDVHCTYTRNQLLAAFEYKNPAACKEGVASFPVLRCDALLMTMNKDEKDYTPNTLYKDFAIDATTIQWQTPNKWDLKGKEMNRYRHHKANGEQLLVFVRPTRSIDKGAAPYVFLGSADYVNAYGTQPVTVTLRLHRPVDPGFLPEISRVVV